MNPNEFLRTPTDEIDFVPFDIETTGFTTTDITTTLTLKYDGEYFVWLNTNGRDADAGDIISEVRDVFSEPVTAYLVPNEGALLAKVSEFMSETVSKDNSVIVAYNGEKWKGGFDLKFLRTASIRNGVSFPFKDYAYTDAIEVFKDKDRFNTVVPSIRGENKAELQSFAEFHGFEVDGLKSEIKSQLEEYDYTEEDIVEWADAENDGTIPTYSVGDLVGVHEVLVGDDGEDIDPFEESVEAVDAYSEGNFTDIILHNLSDVKKTDDLTHLMVEYAPKYDYRPKIL